MPRISESKGRGDENSGYVRLFGNVDVGLLISRVQATVIRAGNELEKILEEKTSHSLKSTLDEALSNQIPLTPSQKVIVFRPSMPAKSGSPGVTGDILILDNSLKSVLVIEVKDGDTFDTKKASGELESMKKISGYVASITGYASSYYFCSFNQEDKEAIVTGAKGRFGIENAMTGRELCELLEIDYDQIREERNMLQSENLEYFLSELLQNTEIREIIEQMLQYEEEEIE
ncbi:MAG: hypothetical protein A2Z14_15300 [Chloroflexi bacterium RBG_16_48_8]|nr:MAG: hypothetical protein A2Z14_15300 [Chloroflexi bacterium RBG_16_48_8]